MLPVCMFIGWSVIAISCQPQRSDVDRPISEATSQQTGFQPTEVQTVTVERSPFRQELMANGRLSAIHKADLRFRVDGLVERLHVSEGSRVQAGQLLATINDEVQQQALQQAA